MQKAADVHETETKPAPVLTCLPADHSADEVGAAVVCLA